MLQSPSRLFPRQVINVAVKVNGFVLFLLVVAAGCQKVPEPSPAVQATAVSDAASLDAGQDLAGADGSQATVEAKLPLLLDLGAGKCIPCKMMAPILDELKEEYAGTFDVVFIDVWEDSSAAVKHGIQSIPTQIFFDATGQERFRHEGFYSKEEILAKWKELGVDLPVKQTEASSASG